MAVDAAVSVAIEKLDEFLIEKSGIFEKVEDDIEMVMVNLRRIKDNARYREQRSTVLMSQARCFLGIVCRIESAIESFCFEETHSKRMGFVEKGFSVVAKELKNLCRNVPPATTTDLSQNVVASLRSKLQEFSREIQEWEKETNNHLLLQPEPRRQERGADYYVPIFEKDSASLFQQLIHSDAKPLQKISVFGETGVGKAAHIEKMCNKPKVKKKFACRAMLSWGGDTHRSVKDLILDILKQVSKDKKGIRTLNKGIEELTYNSLISRLNGFLKKKTYLIIIKAVKRRDLLEDLIKALPTDAENGSAVVITTSNEEAASFADATSRYHYKPLNTADVIDMFSEKVKLLVKGRPLPPAGLLDERLKSKIAEICRGYSVRISLLAGLLSIRREVYEDWSSVLRQPEFAATNSPSFDILDFCYNDLSLHLKPCFLYLGLFQKRDEIPVRRLFRLWLAEGFVMEDTVEAYLNELVKRNMVEITANRSDGSLKKCRMIQSLHNIFRPKAVETGLFHLHQKSGKESNEAAEEHQLQVRRVVECSNIKGYATSQAFNQNLQSYISLNKQKKDIFSDEVGMFLETTIGARGFGLLKVLDLEGVDRPRLPENLGNLYFLRYLGLRCTFLQALPSSLGDLIHLETLDIKHTQITTVPSSIWNMKRLRHLCLNGAPLDISPKSMEHAFPPQLQTLQGLFVDEKIARKIGSTLNRMTKLRTLDLTCESPSETTAITISIATEDTGSLISLPSCLQSLKLRSRNRMGRPSKLDIVENFSSLESLSQLYLLGRLLKPIEWYSIPSGVKVLTLSVSELTDDPMPTLSRLSNLMVLRLLATSYTGRAMHCPTNGFPALRVLKLWKLKNLEILTVEQGTMQNLQSLEIRCCEKLTENNVPDTLLKIEELRNLIVTDMPKEFVNAMRRRKKNHYRIQVNHYMERTSKQ
ncbi:hypothetical protein OSB04_018131 [Centaurea solstitialis]|uniref:Uncharacterized protein n=1 Tax=Centaurea solstitialis TaxID=347529 RepID=A0AA38THF0_9ASTR|nr:hypothetical protein OSB04_018131 [Centaurea solstitialis]